MGLSTICYRVSLILPSGCHDRLVHCRRFCPALHYAGWVDRIASVLMSFPDPIYQWKNTDFGAICIHTESAHALTGGVLLREPPGRLRNSCNLAPRTSYYHWHRLRVRWNICLGCSRPCKNAREQRLGVQKKIVCVCREVLITSV